MITPEQAQALRVVVDPSLEGPAGWQVGAASDATAYEAAHQRANPSATPAVGTAFIGELDVHGWWQACWWRGAGDYVQLSRRSYLVTDFQLVDFMLAHPDE